MEGGLPDVSVSQCLEFFGGRMREDDDPLWKEILTNEILWVVVAVVAILALAFHFATR